MGFMDLRSWVKRLERDASEDLEGFELLTVAPTTTTV
jgi:hypothetical protein